MKEYILSYNTPAVYSEYGWERESLPIGNGYMGMCIFGRYDKEVLQLNEKTLWIGGPSEKRPNYNGGNLKNKYIDLKQMQEYLLAGKEKKAKKIANKLVGIQEGYGSYQNFGELYIKFDHSNVVDYVRKLNINDALAMVSYETNNCKYSSTHFANYPSRVLVSKYQCDKNKLNVIIMFKSAHEECSISYSNNSIHIDGILQDNGLKYAGEIFVNTDGSFYNNENIKIENASYIEIYTVLATDYKNEYPTYRGEDPSAILNNSMNAVKKKGYKVLLEEHLEDYRKIFNKNDLDLLSQKSDLYTDELLKNYRNNTISDNDRKYLEELLYSYGRYLLISSSRKGSLPANLQGVWNNSNNPAWGCDYHLNVNLQMCYWHAYTANLIECTDPLIKYINSLREPGRITAKEYHNIISDKKNPENGWVCHTQNTPFGWTCPGWDFYWGWSPAASSWMMQNCYDYYAYSEDVEKLKNEIYPMMKENCKFWLQNLVYDQKQNRYVSSPSYSPEHGPITNGNTYEHSAIWQLFNDTINAAKILNEDEDFVNQLIKIKDQLIPLEIGRWGQIKEWEEEDTWYHCMKFRKIAYSMHGIQKNHRHSSHLIGVYPGSLVDSDSVELANAVKVSLLDRGFGTIGFNDSGWGKAFKMALWARIKNGDNSYVILKDLVSKNIANNLWDLHPPYQMDGNCGYTAGVTEMLLYSNEDYIELLPALPKAWQNGKVTGLRARGGYTVDLEWKNGELVNCKIAHKTRKEAVIYVNNVSKKCLNNQAGNKMQVRCYNLDNLR